MEKYTYTMAEIAQIIGLHRNTIRKKLKNYDFLLQKDKRKRLYNPIEVEMIKNIFNPTV